MINSQDAEYGPTKEDIAYNLKTEKNGVILACAVHLIIGFGLLFLFVF